jgi:hypothetical protein
MARPCLNLVYVIEVLSYNELCYKDSNRDMFMPLQLAAFCNRLDDKEKMRFDANNEHKR